MGSTNSLSAASLAHTSVTEEHRGGSRTVVVQNMQKKAGLAGRLIACTAPDVLLAQEVNLFSEDRNLFQAHHTSRFGYGTAIFCRSGEIANVRQVACPVAEFGGFIRKKTTAAECAGIQCVSFHGYNGTPRRDVRGLTEHVQEVLKALGPGPAIFAGDFNTWTETHLDAVTNILGAAGFQLAFSWEYPGRNFPLDHVFLRGLTLLQSTTFTSEADHLGATLVLTGGTHCHARDDT